MKRSNLCKGCWIQLRLPVPFRGLFSIPLKLFGIGPSRMNPYSLCNL
jgi:hypothetical protein